MIVLQFDINYLAVLAAGVASMVLGFLWYGPFFGKPWAREMGWAAMTPEQTAEMKRKAGASYAINFIFALVTAYVFAHVLIAFGSDSVSAALVGAAWTWLGFMLPLHAGKKLWMGKSWTLVWIDSGYSLVNLGLAGVILQLWK